jgi:hypothetical protein
MSWPIGSPTPLGRSSPAASSARTEPIAAALWTETAQFALAFAGRWISHGKWLLRELRDLDADLATRWLAARDDPSALAAEILAAAGGPLFDGYRA